MRERAATAAALLPPRRPPAPCAPIGLRAGSIGERGAGFGKFSGDGRRIDRGSERASTHRAGEDAMLLLLVRRGALRAAAAPAEDDDDDDDARRGAARTETAAAARAGALAEELRGAAARCDAHEASIVVEVERERSWEEDRRQRMCLESDDRSISMGKRTECASGLGGNGGMRACERERERRRQRRPATADGTRTTHARPTDAPPHNTHTHKTTRSIKSQHQCRPPVPPEEQQQEEEQQAEEQEGRSTAGGGDLHPRPPRDTIVSRARPRPRSPSPGGGRCSGRRG